jgi:hypothetical protein
LVGRGDFFRGQIVDCAAAELAEQAVSKVPEIAEDVIPIPAKSEAA